MKVIDVVTNEGDLTPDERRRHQKHLKVYEAIWPVLRENFPSRFEAVQFLLQAAASIAEDSNEFPEGECMRLLARQMIDWYNLFDGIEVSEGIEKIVKTKNIVGEP